MYQVSSKIRSFTDLVAWQAGHRLVLLVYQITKKFPSDERFGLTGQMRRAAISITSNIAEGFSRQSSAEKVHFYSIAQGSNTEIQNQLLVARDVGYLNTEAFKLIADQSVTTHKLLNGLMKSGRKLPILDT